MTSSSETGAQPEPTRGPLVTAVIVSYRSKRTIGAALQALRPSKDAGVLEVVVVDNESTDDTVGYVREEFPWVKVIEADGNLGFGRGCNLGFEHADTPYTLFHNPDATLPAEALATLLDFIEARPEVGICAPSIREAGGLMQNAGVSLTPQGLLRETIGLEGYSEMREIPSGGEPFRTNWLCGAMLLVRSEAFRRVDGFDPRFFLYFEETDLCRRIVGAGYELWAVGAARAEHECGASTKLLATSLVDQCASEHFYKSRYYYLIKHHGWLAATLAEVGALPLLGAREIARRIAGKGSDGAFKARLDAPILRLPDRDKNA